MANSKAPKHDFAPAWLKIPSSDIQKPSGAKPAEHGDKLGRPRRDDYHCGFNRFGSSADYMYGPLQRQRSFDSYYDDCRYSPQSNGYNYDKYNGQYRPQSAVFRDSKYQHPNSRYTQMSGPFPQPPPYYDPYFYEYYANDPHYNNGFMRGPSGGSSNGRKHYSPSDKDSKSHTKSDKERESKNDGDTESKKSDNLDEEFPSLNGDTDNSESKAAQPVPSGVWDKGSSAKLVNGRSGESHSNSTADGQPNRQQNSNMYKSLIPSKVTVRNVTIEGGKLGGPSKDLNANHSVTNKLIIPSTSVQLKSSNKDSNKEVSSQSPTPPIDILNLVTTPKHLSDKKSQFLKTLRKDKVSTHKPSDLTCKDSSNGEDGRKEHPDPEKQLPVQNGGSLWDEEPMVNGINDLRVSPDDTVLSSSLEAEQRLLRQMGWNESDDEDYIITEDEKKEFEKLSKQLKDQRNGFKKTVPDVWSPHHILFYQQPQAADTKDGEEDLASSLSEDSDLDTH